MKRLIATASALLVLGGGTWVTAAPLGGDGPAERPRAHAAARAVPAPLSPDSGARVEAVPPFSWRAARRADQYEFQLAADPAFESIVGGTGRGRGAFKTRNTYATYDKALADGTYYWRVRAIDARDRASRWSPTQRFVKRWTTQPQLLEPAADASAVYPTEPLILRWSRVHHAHRYLVTIASDPSLSTPVTPRRQPIDTAATVVGLPFALAPGRYYWGVTPVDVAGHSGTPSAVGSFAWTWPTTTTARVTDANADARVFEPEFSWDPVPGAAEYEIEINSSDDFTLGSKVCCSRTTTATTHAPTKVLANNTYYWRVRAIDVDGNAGVWNRGPDFQKDFDPVVPTVPNLRVRDNESAVADTPPADVDLSTPDVLDLNYPVVRWDPVPGASSYELRIAPNCNLTSPDLHELQTAATAWTPLSEEWNNVNPVGEIFPRSVSRDTERMIDGTSYCVLVRARADRDASGEEVVSDWTQINPAFTYRDASPDDSTSDPDPVPMQAGDYLMPLTGTVTPRAPLFSWRPITGADSYFVVVAKDASFTEIVDVAITKVPAYAVRYRRDPWTYADETTAYYWAVLPADRDNGDGVTTIAQQNAPRSFEKRSVPPTLQSPANGTESLVQPTLRWSAAEGVREYRVQVALDPTFGDPIEDVLTNSTAYTSPNVYPADTLLYWRVRANDERKIGLTWSAAGTFTQRLASPSMDPSNPSAGETIPAILFSPVQGAVSYDVQVDQVDGRDANFNLRAPVFTPTTWYGNGVWTFRVRARFKSGTTQTPGPWSAPFPFARRLGTPAGAHASGRRPSALIEWEAVVGARRYRVEIATSDSFNRVVESATVENTSYAPLMTQSAFKDGSGLWWRVTPLDDGQNPGGAATGPLVSGKRLRLRVRGKLRRGKTSVLTVRVTGPRRAVRGAQVEARGVTSARPRRTGRRGTVRLRLRVTTKGRVTIRAVKRGYRTAEVVLRVR